MRVLIWGATEPAASQVVRILEGDGVEVRVLAESASIADVLRDGRSEVVIADPTDADSLAPTMTDVDAVFVSTPPVPDLDVLEGNIADAATASGVGHVVKLSSLAVENRSKSELAKIHAAAEERVRGSGTGWTMIRANGMMQESLRWVPQLKNGVVFAPLMGTSRSIVDARDVAAAVAVVLRDPTGHGGSVYTATGPEAITPEQEVAALSSVLERPLEGVEVSIKEAVNALIDSGLPVWSAERLGDLYHMYRHGHATDVSPDLARLTGSTPRSYETFARDYVDAFRSGI
jgi:uncharacterized protein YbjT (DUF2867 family)